jgi:hypothetical protein
MPRCQGRHDSEGIWKRLYIRGLSSQAAHGHRTAGSGAIASSGYIRAVSALLKLMGLLRSPIATGAFEMKKHPADVTGRK